MYSLPNLNISLISSEQVGSQQLPAASPHLPLYHDHQVFLHYALAPPLPRTHQLAPMLSYDDVTVSVTESSSPTSELSSSGYQNEAVDLSIDGGDKLHGAEVIGQVSPSSESGLHAEDIVSSRSSNETSNTWACDGTVQSVSWSMSDAVSADISKADHAAGDVCSDHVFSPDSASASDGSPQLGLASIFKPSQKHTSCGLTQVTSIPALFTWWHPISDMSAVKPSLVTCDCVTTNSGGMCTRKDESNFHPSLGDGDVHMVTCATNGESEYIYTQRLISVIIHVTQI